MDGRIVTRTDLEEMGNFAVGDMVVPARGRMITKDGVIHTDQKIEVVGFTDDEVILQINDEKVMPMHIEVVDEHFKKKEEEASEDEPIYRKRTIRKM